MESINWVVRVGLTVGLLRRDRKGLGWWSFPQIPDVSVLSCSEWRSQMSDGQEDEALYSSCEHQQSSVPRSLS